MKPSTPSPAGALLAALALLAAAGCRSCEGGPQPAAPAPAVAAVPAELATLDLPELQVQAPPGEEPPQVEAFVNPWGTAGAFVIRSARGARLARGRSVTREYPGIDLVTFSPDGRKVAFAVPAPGDRVRVVVDGKEGPPFDSVDGLLFTRRGRLAYKARVGERWRLVVDGTAGEERFAIGELRVRPDGETVVVAEQAAQGGPIAVAAYDSRLRRKVLREVPATDLFLDDDATLAAAVVEAEGRKRVRTYDLSGPAAPREGPPCDEVLGVAFGPGGGHVLYAARRGEEIVVVLDDKVEPLPSPALHQPPVLDPARGTAGVVVATDRPFFHLAFAPKAPKARPYDTVTDVAFSPDGSRHAYVAEEGGRSMVVVNGREGPAFDRVVMPRFSPDGAFLVYRARQDGKRFLVVAGADGELLRRHADHELVFPPAFTADGASVAYGAKEGPRLLWRVERLRPDG